MCNCICICCNIEISRSTPPQLYHFGLKEAILFCICIHISIFVFIEYFCIFCHILILRSTPPPPQLHHYRLGQAIFSRGSSVVLQTLFYDLPIHSKLLWIIHLEIIIFHAVVNSKYLNRLTLKMCKNALVFLILVSDDIYNCFVSKGNQCRVFRRRPSREGGGYL